jgi:Spy/CpxP family protein refolding chaperone
MKAAMIFGAALALLEEQRQKLFAIQEEHRQKNWRRWAKCGPSSRRRSRVEAHKQMVALLTPEQR